jgi:hypothetical protein
MSRRLSSGAHSRDPLAPRNDDENEYAFAISPRICAPTSCFSSHGAASNMLLLVKIGSLETRGHDGRCLTWFGEIRSPARRVESRRIWRAKRTSDKPRAIRGRQ